MNSKGSWSEQEIQEKNDASIVDKVLTAFWNKRVLSNEIDRISSFKRFIKYEKSEEQIKIIDEIIDDSIKRNDIESFKILISTFITPSEAIMIDVAQGLGVKLKGNEVQINKITSYDREQLERYMQDEGISASVYIGNTNCELKEGDEILSSNTLADGYYTIHSVTKIFTGILVLRFIEEKIIKESDLVKPICDIFPEFVDSLPNKLKEHFTQYKITLYQLMVHEGGLSDYLLDDKSKNHLGYLTAISTSLKQKSKLPVINDICDFLQYAGPTEPDMINKSRYSNVGFNIIGMLLEYLSHQNFETLLNKYILKEAGISADDFSKVMPAKNAIFNTIDDRPPYIIAGPAAGHWAKLKSLAQFAKWFYEKSNNDTNFKSLLNKWGQEFYKNGIIEHTGYVESSAAFLSISLKTGNILVVLTNQKSGQAIELPLIIKKHIHNRFSSSEQEITTASQLGIFSNSKTDTQKESIDFSQNKGSKRSSPK
ncbi:MAG: hypothetical protein A3F11_04395 [Gammaproteobacteria bacterium RIFCSPHIGHO2_12_FULL_37_14]|nr:MAG: hypothetical protein A3F11_04395 [Gammaproteobacteria bacterium RIFCSPHIGHO2_12_FULL_37_14]